MRSPSLFYIDKMSDETGRTPKRKNLTKLQKNDMGKVIASMSLTKMPWMNQK